MTKAYELVSITLTSHFADLIESRHQLSEHDLRQMLGFETPMQVHALLKEHGAYLHYTLDVLDEERRHRQALA